MAPHTTFSGVTHRMATITLLSLNQDWLYGIETLSGAQHVPGENHHRRMAPISVGSIERCGDA